VIWCVVVLVVAIAMLVLLFIAVVLLVVAVAMLVVTVVARTALSIASACLCCYSITAKLGSSATPASLHCYDDARNMLAHSCATNTTTTLVTWYYAASDTLDEHTNVLGKLDRDSRWCHTDRRHCECKLCTALITQCCLASVHAGTVY
jgi:hypothetical protein